MSHITALEMQAKAFGLRDMDLLKIANTNLPARDAMTDLADRYPGAFSRPLNGLSRAEYEAAKRQYLTSCMQTQRAEDDARVLRRMEEKYRSTKR